jgi:tetratricopeptide (TPR) repeat protein
MWFLWLAGFILEDLWGRPLYAGFYLLAGAAAMQFHAWTNPGSLTPALGASGAVAGLMGAFLVRFPRMKIRMGWLLFWRLIKFDAAAYWLLPAWLLVEVLDGSFASGTGVAHWAHVGGFVFGAGAALAIRHSGWEQKANAAIEKRVNLLNDPEIRQAIGMLDREELAGAAGLLESYLETHPESLDGWSLLAQTYHRKGDLPAYYGAITRVCELHLQAREKEAAWDAFMEFRSRGGISMPVKTWLSVCHVADDLKEFDRSLQEYRKLIAAFPDTREALQANLNAGRISLNNLGRPQEALSFYEAAAASPVPHLDCEQQIQRGITESRSAMSKTAVSGA